MKKWILIVSLLGAFAAQADDKARLEKGEAIVRTVKVKGYEVAAAKMIAIIDAPPSRVWKIIDKCENYETTMPRIAKASELSRVGDKITCSVTVAMPFPLSNLTATTRAKHTVVKDKLYKRAWTLVEGDYKKNTGSWTLTPYGDGSKTYVEYAVHAVPNISIPAFIQKKAQQSSLPKIIEMLRKQTKS